MTKHEALRDLCYHRLMARDLERWLDRNDIDVPKPGATVQEFREAVQRLGEESTVTK